MRIGIAMPLVSKGGLPLDAVEIGVRARWIEQLGFNGTWLNDGSYRGLTTWPDPLMWLLVACVATQSIEVGTEILQVPLRDPVDLAQRFMTLQALTHGRFTVGVGPGSDPLGHAAFGVDFADRFSMLHASMATIRALLRGERVGDAALDPWPSTIGGPKFLLGAWHGDRSLARAALEYDGWLCSATKTSLDTMLDAIKRYRDLGGRRVMVATCWVDLTAHASALRGDEPFNLRCPPEEASERLQALADLGVEDVLLSVFDPAKNGPREGDQWESDFSRDQLEEIRALYPIDTTPPYPT